MQKEKGKKRFAKTDLHTPMPQQKRPTDPGTPEQKDLLTLAHLRGPKSAPPTNCFRRQPEMKMGMYSSTSSGWAVNVLSVGQVVLLSVGQVVLSVGQVV